MGDLHRDTPSLPSLCVRSLALVALIAAGVGPVDCSLAMADTDPQRARVDELLEGVHAAGQLYSDGMFADSATKVAQLQIEFLELMKSQDAILQRSLKPIYSRLARAHGLLELQGAELEPLPGWEELTSSAKPSSAKQEMAPKTTTKQSISFAKDIAPILIERCQGCHISGQRASGNFRMDSFALLLRGGDSGDVISRTNAAESLIIKKLKGEAGERMPAGGRPPLSDDQIQLVFDWIREGAVYDGPSPDTSLETVVHLAWASSASHPELFERRQERSIDRWIRAVPNDQPSTVKNDELFVIGNVPPDRMAKILEQLSKAGKQVKKLLGTSPKDPLLKGGLIVFVLKNRYDYSEFGRMTESRELPKEWLGHWHADSLDACGVLSADASITDRQAEAVALQVVTGAYLGSFSTVPYWFAEGVARNLVRSVYRRGDDRIIAWQRALPTTMLKVESAKTILEGDLDEESAGLVGMSLTSRMMDGVNRRRFDRLLELIREGRPFDVACTATFGAPQALLKAWIGK